MWALWAQLDGRINQGGPSIADDRQEFLKVAIVGCGKTSPTHTWRKIAKFWLPRATLVARRDREMLVAEQLRDALRHPVPVRPLRRHARPRAAGRGSRDAPPQSHAVLSREAIDAGAHVYVEKPFAVDAREARELLSDAEGKVER